VHFICYCFFNFLLWLLFAVISKRHCFRAGKIPRAPYILVCNHISHFDPPMIATMYPRKIDFMAMSDLFKHPVSAFLFRSIETFPVVREKVDSVAVREALRRLKKGHIVGIFPEGGLRSGKESVLEGSALGDGAAAIAQMAGVDVHVSIVVGTDQLYRLGNLAKRKPVYFKYGPVLRLDASLPAKAARAKLTKDIEIAMRALYEELKLEQNLQPEVLPKTAQERWAES